MTPRSTVHGFKVPPEHAITEHELAWIKFIRILSNDSDPSPSLRTVEALRVGLALERIVFEERERTQGQKISSR